jgi:hypothetical protein
MSFGVPVRNGLGIGLKASTSVGTRSGPAPAPPGAPTSVSATSSTATTASVSFTAPVNPGVPPIITGYTVTSSPGGITATGSSSPITVTGLTTGVAYTFTVTATNASGTGPASAPSNSVTPTVPGVVRYTSRLASTSEGSTSDFASNSSGLTASWNYTGTNSDLITITTSGVSAVLQGWTIGNSVGATNSFDFRLVVISGTTSGGTILKQETFTGLALSTGIAQTMVLFSDGGILLPPGTYTVGFAWDSPLIGRLTYFANGTIRTSSSVTGTAGTLGVNYGNVTAFSGSGGLATTNGTTGNGSGQDITFQWRV